MNKGRYEKLPADLKKIIDDTTGLQLSLKGAATYDKKNNEAVEAAKKDREVIPLCRRRNGSAGWRRSSR